MGIFFDFTKEPTQLVEYLKSKELALTFNYEEMMHEAHHKAFTVAKVTKLDLLSDIHTSLQDAIKEGKPFKQWQEEIKPTLQAKGWWGEVEAISPTGEVKNIFVGSRRLKTIYDTNMRVAYAQGRYASQMQSDAEYLRYSAILDARTRPSHNAKNGIILPKHDPWWNTNYPPNGWRCRCKVRAITNTEMQSQGLKVSPRPENIADKDWAYNVGKTDNIEQIYSEKIGKIEDVKLKEVAHKAKSEEEVKLAQNDILFKEIQTLFKERDKKVALCTSTLFGKEKRIILSSDTVQGHLERQDINAFDYSLIPEMLEGEKRIFIQDATKYLVVTKLGTSYRLALKNIEDTDEIYAVSLVNIGSNFEKEVKKLQGKFKEVQE